MCTRKLFSFGRKLNKNSFAKGKPIKLPNRPVSIRSASMPVTYFKISNNDTHIFTKIQILTQRDIKNKKYKYKYIKNKYKVSNKLANGLLEVQSCTDSRLLQIQIQFIATNIDTNTDINTNTNT